VSTPRACFGCWLSRVCCSVFRELSVKHRRYFNTLGIVHPNAWDAIRDHNFAYVYDALHAGFPVNQIDKMSGRTMLHEAAAVGDEDLCEFLLGWEGCSLDARCLVGRDSTLHFAATGGNWRVVDMLCYYGMDPNLLNRFVMTPLHSATNVAVVKCLLRHGADDRLLDRFGRTAAACAEERGDAEVAALLKEVSLTRLRREKKFEREQEILAREAERAKDMRKAAAHAKHDERAKAQYLRFLKEDYAAWRKPTGKAAPPRTSKAHTAVVKQREEEAKDLAHKAIVAKYASKGGNTDALKMIANM
jgi:ankyrin repeat protein